MPFVTLSFPIVLFQLASGGGQEASRAAMLVAAASASPRPAECAPVRRQSRSTRTTVWDRARSPEVQRFCHALARGFSRLARSSADAKQAAAIAEAALPGHAASSVLLARAELAAGDAKSAWEHFAKAQKNDSRSLEAPAALHDLAVAAVGVQRHDDALRAYRSLVVRAGLLDDAAATQRVFVEAALLVALLDDDGLDEAIGYLTEARRRVMPPGFRHFVLGALALVLDLAGRRDQAKGVAAEAEGPWSLARHAEPDARASADRPVLVPGTLNALVATLASGEDDALAREHWEVFVGSSAAKLGWAEHARARLRSLKKGRR